MHFQTCLLRLPLVCQITYQAILTTDGTVSFAVFVYNSDGISAIENLGTGNLIGFDAGDGRRSATVHSLGFPSIDDLTPLNVFRIDGM